MTVAEILKSIKFVVNPNGQQSAVMVDMNLWEQILTILKDAEDPDEMRQARTIKEDKISWNITKKELKLGE